MLGLEQHRAQRGLDHALLELVARVFAVDAAPSAWTCTRRAPPRGGAPVPAVRLARAPATRPERAALPGPSRDLLKTRGGRRPVPRGASISTTRRCGLTLAIVAINGWNWLSIALARRWNLPTPSTTVYYRRTAPWPTMYPASSADIARKRRELAPKQLEAFRQFSAAAFAEGELDARTKQLIAVAVAHVHQCPYCIRGHTQGALKPAPARRK